MRVRSWQVVAASSAALAVSVGFGRFSYGLLLPAMERSSLGSFGRAGWLGTVNLGGYLAGVVVVTALAGRVRPAILLRGGLAGTTAGLGALALAPSFGLLAVAMGLVGFASAGVWIPVTGVVAASTGHGRRGVALGITVAGAGLGVVAADVIATLVGDRFGPASWRAAWATEAALGLVTLLLAVAAIPSGGEAAVPPGPRIRPGLGTLRQLADRGALLVTYGAFGLGYVIYTTFLVAGLERRGGLSPGMAGGVFALLGATSALGGVVLGGVSDRVGRRNTLLFSQLCLAGCAVVLPTASVWVALVSAAAFGILMNGVGAAVVAHLCDSVDPRSVATAFGVLTLAFGAAQCAGPPLGGFLVDATGGFQAAFLTSAGAFVLAGVGAWRLREALPTVAGTAGTGIIHNAAVDVQRKMLLARHGPGWWRRGEPGDRGD